MAATQFRTVARISKDFVFQALDKKAFGRIPVALRLFLVMVDKADDDGEVGLTINRLGFFMCKNVSPAALYGARDHLLEADVIRKMGRLHYINPAYLYLGDWRNGHYQSMVGNYLNLPKYIKGESVEQ